MDCVETFENLEGQISPSRFTMILKVLQSLPDTKSFDLELKTSVARTSLFFSSMLSIVQETCSAIKMRKFKILLALKILKNRGLIKDETQIFAALYNDHKNDLTIEISEDFEEWINDDEFSFFLPFENVSTRNILNVLFIL